MKRPARIWVVAACAALVLATFAGGAFASKIVGYRDSIVITAPGAGGTAADRAVAQKLVDTVVTFTFSEQPLDEALDFLATLGNINIVVDRRKVEAGKTVTLKLTDASLLTAIKFVAEQVGVKWTVRDGVVLFTDEEGAKSEPVTAVYDVSPYLAMPPDFEGPTIELQSISGSRGGGGGGYPGIISDPGDEPKKDSEKSREELLQELVDLIKMTIDPGTWDETP